jgi:Ca2+-binding EF-hand superfamily protein
MAGISGCGGAGGGGQSMFTQMDADGNGKVTKDEMKTAFAARSGSQQGSGPNIDDLFAKIDTNNDGEIDKTEDDSFRAARHAQANQVQQLLQQIFSKIDADGDGSLTTSELGAIGKKDGDSASSFADLVSGFDQNADGKLSLDEFTTGLAAAHSKEPPFGYDQRGDAVLAPTVDQSQFSASA